MGGSLEPWAGSDSTVLSVVVGAAVVGSGVVVGSDADVVGAMVVVGDTIGEPMPSTLKDIPPTVALYCGKRFVRTVQFPTCWSSRSTSGVPEQDLEFIHNRNLVEVQSEEASNWMEPLKNVS